MKGVKISTLFQLITEVTIYAVLAVGIPDFSAAFPGGINFVLGDPVGVFHRWSFQWISWRRRRLHSYAFDGLSFRDTDPYRGRHRSV